MAPKRGGGSSGGSGSSGASSVCPGAFNGYSGYRVEYFVIRVLFWFVLLGVLIAWPKIRKNNPKTKRLIGPFFGFGLVFNFLSYFLSNLMTVLSECDTVDNNSYYPVAIVYSIFYKIADYFLLVVAVWGVNIILRDRLGSYPAFMKIVINSTLSFMALLTIPFIVILSYNLFQFTDAGGYDRMAYEYMQFAVAYWTLYLVNLLVGGILALISISELRTRQIAINPAHLLIVGFYVSMVIWVLFTVVDTGIRLDLTKKPFMDIDPTNMFIAFHYLQLIFYAVSYAMILLIAKNTVWRIQPGVHSHVVGQSYAPVTQTKAEYSTAPQVVPQQQPQQQFAYSTAPQVVAQQQPQPQPYVYPTGQPQVNGHQGPQQFYYPPQTQTPPVPQQQQQVHYNQPELLQGHQTR